MPCLTEALSLGGVRIYKRTNTIQKGRNIADLYHRVFFANGTYLDTLDVNHAM